MGGNQPRFVLFALIVLFLCVFFFLDLGRFFTLEQLRENKQAAAIFYENNRLLAALTFVTVYVFTTALSLPGAAILTLAAGAIFDFWLGILLVSFSSTIGATCAFLAARYVIGDKLQLKFRDKLESVNRGIQEQGAYYLLSLRLIPIFPFFLVNLLMGLTKIPARTYFFVSQIGMLPGTVLYVNAGTQLGQVQSLRDIASAKILLSFAAIGILPLVLKVFISRK